MLAIRLVRDLVPPLERIAVVEVRGPPRAVDWAALFAKKVPAPYVPTIAHATDTSNVLQIEKYASPAQEHDGARWAAHLDDGDPFERWDEISDESYC